MLQIQLDWPTLGLLVSTALILFPLFGLFLLMPLYRKIRRLPLQTQLLSLLILVILYNTFLGTAYSSISAGLLFILYLMHKQEEKKDAN
ncbi:MAG: hypothetical protein J7L47_03110 [Candidatus Odinarchaeota archaeon]|nr:hypothetical protein [Candidatus Odinarchaeota archaeon]